MVVNSPYSRGEPAWRGHAFLVDQGLPHRNAHHKTYYATNLSLSFKQSWLSEEFQAAVLRAGWRLAGPVRLPFGRPGDLPHGFGGSA